MDSEMVVVAAFILAAIGCWWWYLHRSMSLLRSWAERNDLTIVSSERRRFLRGPFFWRSGKGHCVFRVAVRDGAGRTRNGYVRCGSWLGGLLSDQVDVRWDDSDE